MPSGVTMRGRKRCHSRPIVSHVHVVVVVVGDEHGVDLRQVVEGDARRIDALRAGKRERARALRPDRIDRARCAPASGSGSVACPTWAMRSPSPSNRAGGRSGGNGLGKLAGQAAPRSPNCHLRKRARALRARHAARIEEAHAVEMVRQRALVVGVGARRRTATPSRPRRRPRQRPASSASGGGSWHRLSSRSQLHCSCAADATVWRCGQRRATGAQNAFVFR